MSAALCLPMNPLHCAHTREHSLLLNENVNLHGELLKLCMHSMNSGILLRVSVESCQSTSMCLNAGQMPKVYKTKKGGMYMKTAGGSTVGVSEDEAGRVFMFDRVGNLYYDTGDKRLGFYIVNTFRSSPHAAELTDFLHEE